ncbi:MAG: hypothetical protein AB2710_03375 [Candidatus Thiodiazotropha sp.]
MILVYPEVIVDSKQAGLPGIRSNKLLVIPVNAGIQGIVLPALILAQLFNALLNLEFIRHLAHVPVCPDSGIRRNDAHLNYPENALFTLVQSKTDGPVRA